MDVGGTSEGQHMGVGGTSEGQHMGVGGTSEGQHMGVGGTSEGQHMGVGGTSEGQHTCSIVPHMLPSSVWGNSDVCTKHSAKCRGGFWELPPPFPSPLSLHPLPLPFAPPPFCTTCSMYCTELSGKQHWVTSYCAMSLEPLDDIR